MQAEAAAVQARTTTAAVTLLLSALSSNLRDELDDSMTPYELWSEVHAKGHVLVDDCRFFGLLENVRLADDDALPDGLARLEEHIQRFVDVIFVPSHGSDARLLAAADRLKMALLCNACPPAMVDVFEAWRADEPAWEYGYMRRRLVEHWASNLRLLTEVNPPAVVTEAPSLRVDDEPPAVVETLTADDNFNAQMRALARDLAMASNEASSPRTEQATGRDASEEATQLATDDDVDATPATTSTQKPRRKKRSPDANDESQDSASTSHGRKRSKPTATPKTLQGAVALEQPHGTVAKRVSPRQHLGSLRVLRPSPESSENTAPTTDARQKKPFSEQEIEFLRAAAGLIKDSTKIYHRGRALGLFTTDPYTRYRPSFPA
ncbi:hypothetical protein SDRG_11107 [Saprolegnia diclina VS20]|uniref:Uncharacterized protein n=1 Tax=Saprolegnia diclina (strain VS20) TaxID=1156394 RepID=T0Q934_SAPDV|nr:hypothetical protein SDRG_11107 [Saprolegnia diclina VS20]EQC31181.1 hypothetical protein SDRG_11107 [Saprolegnia diclina VS20]|eukprot:XP_008615354.1 hypothetical protein SDRG_11107 [Saprolegnia diclina VS20]